MFNKKLYKREKEIPQMPVTNNSMMENITSDWRNATPVIDHSLCSKCMICWKFCPEVSVRLVGDKPIIDYDYCKGCGICVVECPNNAIMFWRWEENENNTNR